MIFAVVIFSPDFDKYYIPETHKRMTTLESKLESVLIFRVYNNYCQL